MFSTIFMLFTTTLVQINALVFIETLSYGTLTLITNSRVSLGTWYLYLVERSYLLTRGILAGLARY